MCVCVCVCVRVCVCLHKQGENNVYWADQTEHRSTNKFTWKKKCYNKLILENLSSAEETWAWSYSDTWVTLVLWWSTEPRYAVVILAIVIRLINSYFCSLFPLLHSMFVNLGTKQWGCVWCVFDVFGGQFQISTVFLRNRLLHHWQTMVPNHFHCE